MTERLSASISGSLCCYSLENEIRSPQAVRSLSLFLFTWLNTKNFCNHQRSLVAVLLLFFLLAIKTLEKETGWALDFYYKKE